MSLEKLFDPKSIALVGASEEEGKVGNVIARNLLSLGYKGDIFFVNNKNDQLFGKECFSSLEKIKKPVDVAIVAIPAKFVNEIVKKSSKKVKNFVIISAGYSEIGKEGKKREGDLLKIAKKNNLNILGPNCLGFIVPDLGLNASFAGGLPEAGNISFVSQSGALAVAMMDVAKQEGMRFSKIISVGNKMQLDEGEFLEYLVKDEKTSVIGMYVEGVKDGLEFLDIARRTSRKKPIVILKAGRTEKAQKAIASHTGALAGSDDIVSAVFEKAGVIRAESLEEFFDLLKFLSFNAPTRDDEVIVITNAGGPGVLTSDAFSGKAIRLADISDPTKKEIRKFLPEEGSVENPVDLLGDAKEDRYEKALWAMEKEDVGTVICVLTPQDQTPVGKIAEVIIDYKKKTQKKVIAVFIGGERVSDSILKMEKEGIFNSRYPEAAIKVVNKAYLWGKFTNIRLSKKGESLDTNFKRRRKAIAIINQAKDENRSALYYSEAREIMELYGVNAAPSIEIMPKQKDFEIENGKINFPLVLKVDSDNVLHKTEKKGLILGISNREELNEAIERMRLNFPASKLIVQPELKRMTELIVGIKRDPVFGPIVIAGLGGIFTEIFKTVDFFVPPMDMASIERKLSGGKTGFLFRETRGQRPYDLEEVANIIRSVGIIAHEIPEISGFDINPLLVYNDRKEAVAVDVKIII